MNAGTIVRTILVIATSLNTALMATDITGFNSPKLELAYKVLSVILNFIIVGAATYYNNDYTEEACIGTGYTRLLKAQKMGYVGEKFDDNYEFEEEDEDVEEGTEEEEKNEL